MGKLIKSDIDYSGSLCIVHRLARIGVDSLLGGQIPFHGAGVYNDTNVHRVGLQSTALRAMEMI